MNTFQDIMFVFLGQSYAHIDWDILPYWRAIIAALADRSEVKNLSAFQRGAVTNYTIDANPFVEQLLEQARPLIRQNLEPVDLPEYTYKISQSVVITEVSGRHYC